MITNAILILVLPLFAFTVQIFVGKRLPKQGAWLPTGAMFAAFLLAVPIFIDAVSHYDPNYVVAQQSWEWINFGPVVVTFGIFIDNLTAIMLIVVTLISSLIHLYSIGYMHGDARYSRYFAYLALFSFSMLGLVLVDNFFGIYVFWELVGLCSYLLIGFWFEKDSAANASKKAFITNRVGDVGMFAGILIIFSTLGVFNFHDVFRGVADGQLSGGLLTAAGILLFCGAVGKSAQFPLHVWLPDAMEGPTPVSALIHAATMVAAGVYMVGRTFVFFTQDALLVIAYIGTITAFMAATIAVVQRDIKRVLAYSTISQLGYMMVGLGTGGYTSGLFHLTTHAFFKALLFLGSGSVIHALHTQDMQEMGGLRKKMPITFWTFLMATLAISGVPPFSGFWSKDAILGAALEFGFDHPQHMVIFVVMLISAGITSFYMFRLVFLTFTGEARDKKKFDHAHESPWVMTVPLSVLALFSIGTIWWGWFEHMVAKPELATYATAATHLAVASEAGHEAAHSAHNLALVLSVLVAGLGILFAALVYYWKKISAEVWGARLKPVYTLLWNKYYFDELYQATFIAGTLLVSRLSALFDMKVIDGVVNGAARMTRQIATAEGIFDLRFIDGLVNLVGRMIGALGKRLRGLQTGQVQTYILMALFAVVLLYIMQQF
ncbi:MAG: NADH-quinone oxidoreductase subunit L [Calditrichaeota bacterium]|nr:MAG: NADH-quinone oxidoreductase subunit L [Calditrichota bacterium]